jgi:hypothetical protein
MNDQDEAFDLYLRKELTPIDRGEDVAFSARVQALVALDSEWAANRRAMNHRLVRELIAILGLGAGVAAVAAAPSWALIVSGDRAIALAALILGFGMLVFLLSRPDSRSWSTAELAPFPI